MLWLPPVEGLKTNLKFKTETFGKLFVLSPDRGVGALICRKSFISFPKL